MIGAFECFVFVLIVIELKAVESLIKYAWFWIITSRIQKVMDECSVLCQAFSNKQEVIQ